LAARDGRAHQPGTIPDGFYLVGDSANPRPEFQKAIIDAVEKVTHIAPPDAEGRITGEVPAQGGVINYPVARLGLCAGLTGAPYVTTTEVYPDSPRATPPQCNDAQAAAGRAAIDYVLAHGVDGSATARARSGGGACPGRQRLRAARALGAIAARLREPAQGRLVFDAFGGDLRTQLVGELDRGAHDRAVRARIEHGHDEGPVDLELVRRQLAQVGQ